MFQVQLGLSKAINEVTLTGYTSVFGGDISVNPPPNQPPLRFRRSTGVPVVRSGDNPYGCLPYSAPHDDVAILINRGECTFLEKLTLARAAGAAGVIIVSHEDFGVNPSATEEELSAAGDLNNVAIVVLTNSDGKIVTDLMDSAEASSGQLMVALETRSPTPETGRRKVPDRILFLNGHPLLNTKLLI